MCKYSPKVSFKLLLPLIFLSFIFCPGYSYTFQSSGAVKVQTVKPVVKGAKDTAKAAVKVVKDTVKANLKETKDTAKTALNGAKDTAMTGVKQGGDTVSAIVKDTLKAVVSDTLSAQIPDSVLFAKVIFTGEELIRGERLFYGLAYTSDIAINCSKCHNTRVSDTLNWNPDAIDISQKYLHKGAADLKKILLKPSGVKLMKDHKGFQLTTEDIVLMKAYMDLLPSIGLKQSKPEITWLLLLIIAFILFAVSITGLIIKKVFYRDWINWIIISLTGVFITWVLAVNAIAFGRARGFAPDQPVKFSHAVHAGQNKIDCNYCHYGARSGKSAGIPPGSICMNCHFLVRTGTRSGVTEIAKVLNAFDKKIPVDWIRIYKLPDFVFFSHAQHVTAGRLNCEECHGEVKEMHRLSQVPDLSMGWCIKCHDTKKVNISNGYYRTYYSDAYDSLMAGRADSLSVTDIGGRNCGKCHY